jgi:hypothetical protein
LVAFQSVAPGDHLTGRVGDDDLQSLRCGVDQDAIARVIRVDPGAGKG